MEAKERIREVIKYLNLSAKALAEEVGYKHPQKFYDILNNKTKSITEEVANKITSKYPDINRVWLLTGEGEMLKPPAANVVENTNNSGSITQTTTTAAPSPSSAALDRALSEIAEQRKLVADSHALTAASQAQVDRLLAIIENMTSRK